MQKKKHSRTFLVGTIIVIIGGALTYAFWPKPMLVDIGEVRKGTLIVTIREEGRTRVHDTYIVSTPVVGRLLRVDVEPGDVVMRGETIVARMLPVNPSVMDVRTREQAQTAVTASQASLRVAQADYNMTVANHELALSGHNRSLQLFARDLVSEAAVDLAKREVFAAQAARDTAEAAIAMREAELANTQAQLIGFNDLGLVATPGVDRDDVIELIAPASGRILRVLQQSETTLPVGTPVMEIGNIDQDLEIAVELLSTDAVQVEVGDRVIIDNWGGEDVLGGKVTRIDPFGFSKYSALGVEEQRVNAFVEFTGPSSERENLGHGFRVEVQIVIWEEDNAVIVPAGALFRDGENWAVFVVNKNIVNLRQISLTKSNGIEASVTEGLKIGDQIVLYPSSSLEDGAAVAQRLTL